MTWTKLGDEFPPEARDLTDAEFRTHVEALIWSNERLLDLVVPKRDVRRFAESAEAESAIPGLIAKGWWEDSGDNWYVGLRFADWQEERTDAERRREMNALRNRRYRKHRLGDHSVCDPRRCKDARKPVDNSPDSPKVTTSQNGSVTHHATRDGIRDATPSRPDPTRPEGNGSGKGTRPVQDGAARQGADGRAGPPGPADRATETPEVHNQPACAHGTPGGDMPNGSGALRCPQCRMQGLVSGSFAIPEDRT
jgi:hypothetical protein